jgi:radical SAM protein with 4Fe4S-binding SPASM domain
MSLIWCKIVYNRLKLLSYAREIGYKNILVNTNAILMDHTIIDFIKNIGIILRVQVYSHLSKITDSITKVNGAHDKIIKALELIVRANIPYEITIVKEKKYRNYFNACLAYYNTHYTPKRVNISLIYPNRVSWHAANHDKWNKQFFITNIRDLLAMNFDKTIFFNRVQGNECWEETLFVAENGDVMPCHYFRKIKITNIREKSIAKIIRDRDLDLYWDLSRDNIEVCKDCEFRYLCFNCRPLEILYKNNSNYLFSKNRYCNYNPYKGIWQN